MKSVVILVTELAFNHVIEAKRLKVYSHVKQYAEFINRRVHETKTSFAGLLQGH